MNSFLSRHQHQSDSTAPIKAYSRRGFAIGWIVIICLGIAGYALASSQLAPATADLRLADFAKFSEPFLNTPPRHQAV